MLQHEQQLSCEAAASAWITSSITTSSRCTSYNSQTSSYSAKHWGDYTRPQISPPGPTGSCARRDAFACDRFAAMLPNSSCNVTNMPATDKSCVFTQTGGAAVGWQAATAAGKVLQGHATLARQEAAFSSNHCREAVGISPSSNWGIAAAVSTRQSAVGNTASLAVLEAAAAACGGAAGTSGGFSPSLAESSRLQELWQRQAAVDGQPRRRQLLLSDQLQEQGGTLAPWSSHPVQAAQRRRQQQQQQRGLQLSPNCTWQLSQALQSLPAGVQPVCDDYRQHVLAHRAQAVGHNRPVRQDQQGEAQASLLEGLQVLRSRLCVGPPGFGQPPAGPCLGRQCVDLLAASRWPQQPQQPPQPPQPQQPQQPPEQPLQRWTGAASSARGASVEQRRQLLLRLKHHRQRQHLSSTCAQQSSAPTAPHAQPALPVAAVQQEAQPEAAAAGSSTQAAPTGSTEESQDDISRVIGLWRRAEAECRRCHQQMSTTVLQTWARVDPHTLECTGSPMPIMQMLIQHPKGMDQQGRTLYLSPTGRTAPAPLVIAAERTLLQGQQLLQEANLHMERGRACIQELRALVDGLLSFCSCLNDPGSSADMWAWEGSPQGSSTQDLLWGQLWEVVAAQVLGSDSSLILQLNLPGLKKAASCRLGTLQHMLADTQGASSAGAHASKLPTDLQSLLQQLPVFDGNTSCWLLRSSDSTDSGVSIKQLYSWLDSSSLPVQQLVYHAADLQRRPVWVFDLVLLSMLDHQNTTQQHTLAAYAAQQQQQGHTQHGRLHQQGAQQQLQPQSPLPQLVSLSMQQQQQHTVSQSPPQQQQQQHTVRPEEQLLQPAAGAQQQQPAGEAMSGPCTPAAAGWPPVDSTQPPTASPAASETAPVEPGTHSTQGAALASVALQPGTLPPALYQQHQAHETSVCSQQQTASSLSPQQQAAQESDDAGVPAHAECFLETGMGLDAQHPHQAPVEQQQQQLVQLQYEELADAGSSAACCFVVDTPDVTAAPCKRRKVHQTCASGSSGWMDASPSATGSLCVERRVTVTLAEQKQHLEQQGEEEQQQQQHHHQREQVQVQVQVQPPSTPVPASPKQQQRKARGRVSQSMISVLTDPICSGADSSCKEGAEVGQERYEQRRERLQQRQQRQLKRQHQQQQPLPGHRAGKRKRPTQAKKLPGALQADKATVASSAAIVSCLPRHLRPPQHPNPSKPLRASTADSVLPRAQPRQQQLLSLQSQTTPSSGGAQAQGSAEATGGAVRVPRVAAGCSRAHSMHQLRQSLQASKKPGFSSGLQQVLQRSQQLPEWPQQAVKALHSTPKGTRRSGIPYALPAALLGSRFAKPATSRALTPALASSSSSTSALATTSRSSSRASQRGVERSRQLSTDSCRQRGPQLQPKQLALQRSGVHGFGLFAAEPIAAGDFVIEYVGLVIRAVLEDVVERRYQGQGQDSSYLFRLDSDRVADATVVGGRARYINHSCDPNCYSKAFSRDHVACIGIFAKRDIALGEELSYDYMFEFEEGEQRVRCYCAAPDCRGYMN